MVAQFKTEYSKVDYTLDEYWEFSEKSEGRNEYIDGEIKPMTGGTPNHNEIAGNFYTFLKLALRGKGYKVFMSDVRLGISRYNVYTYPDIMLIKGKPVLQDNRHDTVINPLLIIEVLSKSTKNYDQGDKFDYYRSIPGFAEYILVDQYSYSVKQFAKADDGRWWLSEYQDANDIVKFASLDFEIELTSIYEDIEFN